MKINNYEINTEYFNNIKLSPIILRKKEFYGNDKKYFEIFRKYIFDIYNINPHIYNPLYSEVVLIKRGEKNTLLNDPLLETQDFFKTNGRLRREIHDINHVDEYLLNKYADKYKSVFLEDLSFDEQIRIFNNAKMIVCAHGAGMSNMFFCKKNTVIVEVTCNTSWKFFDNISSNMNLRHYKCKENNCHTITQFIDSIPFSTY